MYKNNLDKLEIKFQASVGEINKGNDIIQRIHAEQRQLRSKVKVKGVIMAKQEEHLAEKEKEIDIARAKSRELESSLSRANDRIARIEGELERKTSSLAEANKLLKTSCRCDCVLSFEQFWSILLASSECAKAIRSLWTHRAGEVIVV